ncbi:leucine-rich repeat protein [Polaribacter sp. Hel1_85]|uniref:leucine-rich repeat protein n=1 Tax=Polaribacter sp. Hel1_85 TaxID=1250005 RepID=UPI00052C837B|nr:leucine-rich repeat protein [Polaribacter sp. Hel1_85]KGL58869.1 cell surface leucine-rich repeat protein-containing protein [Polaribacter sp. Hel1_85]
MKKTLLLFVTILSVTLTKAQAIGDTFTVNDINYEVTAIDPTNEVQIVGNSVTTDALTIPATVDDSGTTYNVTFIKNKSFSNVAITSLVVEGDTEIDWQVFNACPNLVSADLSNITSGVGLNSFVNCPLLETVDLSKATYIGKLSFSKCPKLTTIDLSNLKEVGIQAFLSATSLTSIDLPAATVLGGLAFWKCTNLSDINIPVMDSIAPGAFNATGITTLTLPATLNSLPGTNTFRNIPALEELIVEFETPFVLEIDEDGLDMFSHQALYATAPKLIVPFGTSTAFAAENGWDIFNIVEADEILSLDSQAKISLNAYPNPVVDKLYFSTNDVFSAEVYNILGAKVSSQKVTDGVDLSQLNKGIYFVKAKNNEGLDFKTIKVIKQ